MEAVRQVAVRGSVPDEFRPLLDCRLLDDASSCQVVWARVKGYPFWPVRGVAPQFSGSGLVQKQLGDVRVVLGVSRGLPAVPGVQQCLVCGAMGTTRAPPLALACRCHRRRKC